MKDEKKFLQPDAYIIKFFTEDIITSSDPFDDNDDVSEFNPGDIH